MAVSIGHGNGGQARRGQRECNNGYKLLHDILQFN
jgi:hypothetical protein